MSFLQIVNSQHYARSQYFPVALTLNAYLINFVVYAAENESVAFPLSYAFFFCLSEKPALVVVVNFFPNVASDTFIDCDDALLENAHDARTDGRSFPCAVVNCAETVYVLFWADAPSLRENSNPSAVKERRAASCLSAYCAPSENFSVSYALFVVAVYLR